MISELGVSGFGPILVNFHKIEMQIGTKMNKFGSIWFGFIISLQYSK